MPGLDEALTIEGEPVDAESVIENATTGEEVPEVEPAEVEVETPAGSEVVEEV